MSIHDLASPFPARPRRAFFSRVDWASFWTATLASFLVYFFTAAPSVTLEDAGELVTAGDHLGVPHPPGYPIWTVCAFAFARALSFVKYMGQPNPAWAISIMSGFFGAVAAGLTAMLITRSAADMLADFDRTDDARADASRHALLSWAGGVAGSLVFAFSPVEWSQSTIPEVYTLNALFLMWVFLLSYRWMRQPGDRLLWAVAFIFGLGLTNYQMLLFAIVPLVVIILLKDIGLFRDFALTSIPFLVTAGIMMLGAEVSQPGFMKNAPFKGYGDLLGPPLASPVLYATLVALIAVVVGSAIVAGIRRRRASAAARTPGTIAPEVFVAAGAGVLLALVALAFPTAPEYPNIANVPASMVFHWGKPAAAFLALMAALWAFAWTTPGGRWYASAVTAIELPLAILLKKGVVLGLTHPLTGWFAFYLALNFVVLALAWSLLPRGRSVAVAYLCAEAGVAFYGYMPISSETNPPMNWGYPRTWAGFKHAIMREQYEKLIPTNPFSPIVIDQLGGYFSDLRKQFTLLLVPLGFLPFTLWRLCAATPADGQASTGKTRDAGTTAFDCFAVAFALAVLVAAFATLDRLFDKASAFVPAWAYMAAIGAILVCVGIGFTLVAVRQFQCLWGTAGDGSRSAADRVTAGVSLVAAGLFLGVMVVGMCRAVAAYRIVGPDPAPGALEAAGAKVAVTTVALALVAVAVAVGIAALGSRSGGRRLRMKIDDTAQQWFVALFACFVVMSFLVIVMAAPKGDLQDNFIQKVKFISSHAIFSLWIGYGIVFGLALVATLERHLRSSGTGRNPLAVGAALAVLVAAPLVPVHENYCNDGLIEEMSSASQDGHDFGWQFGNYQLRGAEAIAEELSGDEEPLPNPDYPPAMTTNAVFYGGTDPGRFVPTYMIFSADVRPDVFLITQNALADNTYMDTMRDMYGDQIWMPSPKDNADAFEKYVAGVRNGTYPDYGGITEAGGRVQVNGALAVMEINGILTEQIFRQNRDRHDFYVEESYAMRWMYPYEIPHGLIMKVRHDPGPVPRTVSDADMDFWDWYSRRLLATPKYRRDFTARKSFSKLRSAIAGLYSAHRRDALSERAYREAVRLYPASPESNMRLVQELLAPQGRFGEALRLLEALQAADPNNRRIPEMTAQIRRLDNAHELERTLGGKDLSELSAEEAVNLAEVRSMLGKSNDIRGPALAAFRSLASLSADDRYRLGALLGQAGAIEESATAFAAIPRDALLASGSGERIRTVASVLVAGGRRADAVQLLAHYLRETGRQDWQAWLLFSSFQLQQGKTRDAVVAMEQARQIAARDRERLAEPFLKAIEADPNLAKLFQSLLQPSQSPVRQTP